MNDRTSSQVESLVRDAYMESLPSEPVIGQECDYVRGSQYTHSTNKSYSPPKTDVDSGDFWVFCVILILVIIFGLIAR